MKTFAMDTCSPKKIWRSNHVWNLIHHVACVHLGFWDRFNGYMSSSTSYYRRIYFMKTHDDNKISWIFIQKMEINGMLWDVSDKILQTRWYKVMKSNNANDYTFMIYHREEGHRWGRPFHLPLPWHSDLWIWETCH
mgnify:CR=1 FL=1